MQISIRRGCRIVQEAAVLANAITLKILDQVARIA